ncbi:hypothetical protein HDU96_001195 [Phlyctochytrium bullatum]|nr:hypothetical protein HDU96_001195 [Phlyctochytrium bullatum]
MSQPGYTYQPAGGFGSNGYNQSNGYNPNNSYNPQQASEQELRGLVTQTLDSQADSASTAKKIAEMALRAEQTAAGSLAKLGRQGEQLNTINNRLDGVNDNLDRADAKATHLVQLDKRPFFIPVSSKVAKASAEASKRPEPEQQSSSWFSWLGLGGGAGGEGGDAAAGGAGYNPEALGPPPVIKPRTSSMVEYQAKVGAWATEEEQARSKQHEKEIHESIEVTSDALDRLKMVGMAIGQETERQNALLSDIQGKVDVSQEKVDKVNRKVRKVLK